MWWWLRVFYRSIEKSAWNKSQYVEWYYKGYVEEMFAAPSLLDEISIFSFGKQPDHLLTILKTRMPLAWLSVSNKA